MNREMKRRAWRRLHMEQPYSMTQDSVSGGVCHLYAGLKGYENDTYEEIGGKLGDELSKIARRAIVARRLIERKVLITRDEVFQYMKEDVSGSS